MSRFKSVGGGLVEVKGGGKLEAKGGLNDPLKDKQLY